MLEKSCSSVPSLLPTVSLLNLKGLIFIVLSASETIRLNLVMFIS